MDMIVLDLRHRRRTRLDEPAEWTAHAALDRLATISRSVAKANPEFTSGATGSVCDDTDTARVLAHISEGKVPAPAHPTCGSGPRTARSRADHLAPRGRTCRKCDRRDGSQRLQPRGG